MCLCLSMPRAFSTATRFPALTAALLTVGALACTSAREERPLTAQAFIEAGDGHNVRGMARFTETQHGLFIELDVVSGPAGFHAVQINDCGDCAALAEGGHFNPEHHAHGERGAPAGHAGDLGNIEIAANGLGRIEFVTERLTLRAGEHSIVGRTIAIDERRDQPLVQPWGDSGAPIACGVIRLDVR